MATNYVQDGDILTIDAGATVSAGGLVGVGAIFGVALSDMVSGTAGPVIVEGVVEAPKTTANVVAAGDILNYDASVGELTSAATAAAGDITGAAVAVAASDGTTATVNAKILQGGTAS